MLFGYTDSNINEYYAQGDIGKSEYEVTKFVNSTVSRLLDNGKIVIIDQTNLSTKYLNEWKKFDVPVEYHFMEKPIDVCIHRDSLRVRKVGEKVINKQYDQWRRVKKEWGMDVNLNYSLNVVEWEPESITPYSYNSHIQDHCIIVDMDGTLSEMGDRSPYDGDRVDEDTCHEHVKMVVNNYKDRYGPLANVFVFSAREDKGKCREKTLKWLNDNNVLYDQLVLRKEKDHRRDWIVKYEMFNENVRDKFNIKLVLEDRAQMLRYYDRMNLPVLSNNPLLKEY